MPATATIIDLDEARRRRRGVPEPSAEAARPMAAAWVPVPVWVMVPVWTMG